MSDVGTAAGTKDSPLELWGGIECSVVRVGDRWRDQVRETGHHDRVGDLDRVAGLGIRTLRYPLLWERLARDPDGPDGWRWHDERMAGLQARGIEAIAGLLHHGSGPPGTDLLDPAFPDALAAHARAVAERYPWVTAWTPVNEPLTTARFSCLYGFWYPHGHDQAAFLRAVANQCRAVLLAMRAVRAVTPAARLVQTEDIGRTFSTPLLSRQAGHDNERRWLSFDLLFGRVDRAHPWRTRLLEAGVTPRHLDDFLSGDGAPDLIGVNHYVTSDRFLDHRSGLYPGRVPGGDGPHAYVDVEAVRCAIGDGTTGWEARLREVWQRYARPIAITEVHLGCDDRTEQVRWLLEAWQAVRALRAEGADIRAVTVWALFGCVDWDSMQCEVRGHYEAGVWDVRQDPPGETPLFEAVSALARRGTYDLPAPQEQGWWRRTDRLLAGLG